MISHASHCSGKNPSSLKHAISCLFPSINPMGCITYCQDFVKESEKIKACTWDEVFPSPSSVHTCATYIHHPRLPHHLLHVLQTLVFSQVLIQDLSGMILFSFLCIRIGRRRKPLTPDASILSFQKVIKSKCNLIKLACV